MGKVCSPTSGHSLAFEEPIEVNLSVNIDGKQRQVFIGRAYQNEYGYWAQTDAGILPWIDIEEALISISANADLEGRGLRRIDPPAAVVQKDAPCTTFVGDGDHCRWCGVGIHQHGGAFTSGIGKVDLDSVDNEELEAAAEVYDRAVTAGPMCADVVDKALKEIGHGQ